MSVVCNHISKAKKEQLCNFLKDKKNISLCDSKKPHNDKSELWMCLNCGNLGCSIYSTLKCSENHYKETRHCLAINIKTHTIWCYECENDLQSIVEDNENFDEDLPRVKGKGNKNKVQIEKISDFIEDMSKTVFSVLKQHSNKAPVIVSNQNEDENWNLTVIPKRAKEKVAETVSIFGLRNLGNTCFFNSVMQCLNGCTKFREIYLLASNSFFDDIEKAKEKIDEPKPVESSNNSEDEANPPSSAGGEDGWVKVDSGKTKGKKNKKNKKHTITETPPPKENKSKVKLVNINRRFRDFLLESRASKNHVYDPTGLHSGIMSLFSRFRGYGQQDAQELLRCLLDALSMGEEKVMKRSGEDKGKGKLKTTHVEKIFGGYLCNYLKCLSCDKISRTFDFFLDITLPIKVKRSEPENIIRPKNKSPPQSKNQKKSGKKNKKNKVIIINDETEEQQEKIQDEKLEDENDLEEVKEIERTEFEENISLTLTKEIEKAKIENETKESNSRFNVVSASEIPEDDIIPYFERSSQKFCEPKWTASGTGGFTLENCLKEFTSVEVLTESNNYYKCEHCLKLNKENKSTLRKFFIYEPPQILTIVLKRFQHRANGSFEKISEHVSFSETLNIDSHTLLRINEKDSPDDIPLSVYNYILFGVVVHSGSLGGGHYVAYVKHDIDGDDVWYNYSDTSYKQVSLSSVLNSQAYILFYKRI